MIKATELKSTGKAGIRFRSDDAAALNLESVKEMILKNNEESYGLPIQISKEQIKSGNLLKSTIEDCLIITNKEHPGDYFKYCLTLRKQGKMATISFQYYGSSILTGKAQDTEDRKKTGTLGGMLANALFGVDQAAFDAEYEYYAMLDSLLQETFA